MMQRKYPKPSIKIVSKVRRYQIKHPEIIGGKKVAGRIALTKRAELNRVLADIVLEKGLSEIVCKTTSNQEVKQELADYALKICNGNKAKALDFLDEKEHLISHYATEANVLIASHPYFDNVAKREGEHSDFYKPTTAHMLSTLSNIGQLFFGAKTLLKK